MAVDAEFYDGGYFCNLQENPQQTTSHLLLPQQQGFGFLGINNHHQGASTSNGFDFTSMALSQSVSDLLEKQRQEIDWVLRLQNERLITTLRKEARQEIGVLLQIYESQMKSLMCQRDEDLSSATKKTMELEECLRSIEMENQTWQKKAQESEAKVAELNNTLTQARERVVIDAESVCDFSPNRGDQNRVGDKNRGVSVQETEEIQSKNIDCKLCNARISCVLFLPCRHLCSCKCCEAFLRFCPVCQSVKEASMEVFLA